MEEITLERRKLTEDELKIVIEKSSEFVKATLTAFNDILARARDEKNDPYLEGTAVMQALSTIAISIISSLSGEKEKTCVLLTEFIDHLDAILMQLEETPQEDPYKASEAPQETNEEWMARQRSSEHDVTCSEELNGI